MFENVGLIAQVAEAVEAFARDFQGRQEAAFPGGKKMPTDLDYAGLWKQFQQVRTMCAYCLRVSKSESCMD